LSADDCDPLALQMVQEGAQDYIAKGSCNGDLLVRAIQYAVVRYSSQGRRPAPSPCWNKLPSLACWAPKEGRGTTLACNLAVELRRQTGQKTLLADLDVSAVWLAS